MNRSLKILTAVATLALLATGPAAVRADTEWCFVAGLDESSVVPPSGAPGTGHVLLFLNEDQNEVSFFLELEGVVGQTSAGFYLGGPGETGELLFSIPVGDQVFGTWPVTQDIVDALFNDGVYVQVFTEDYPEGALRGDITFCAVPDEDATWGTVKSLYR